MPNSNSSHSRRLRAETAAAYNKRVAAEGGSRFSVLLSAKEADALAAIQARTGESKAAAVKRLIMAAAAGSISEPT